MRRLRRVHGRVGEPQQVGDVVGLVGSADHADAGSDAHPHPGERHRPAHQLVDPLRTVVGIVEVHTGEQGGELVPTEAGQDVGGAQRGTDPLAQLLQQLVARVVTEAVVHRLEPVEVEQQERRGSTAAQLLPEPEHQRPPVRQARQVVGGGLPAHLVQRAHLLEGDGRPAESGQQAAQRAHRAHADAGLSPLQGQHDQAGEVARQRKGEGPPPGARTGVGGRVVVKALRAGQHRGRAGEQRRGHPAQIDRSAEQEGALRLRARHQDVADQLEGEGQREQQQGAVTVESSYRDDRGQKGQQQHVRHRIGQGRRVGLQAGHVQPRREDEGRDDGGHAERADGAVQPGRGTEARHPDMDECEQVQRDQWIDREVGQFGERREGARRGGVQREEQVADHGERPRRADRPPRDPLGPHASCGASAEGCRAERYDVVGDQVVEQAFAGGVRNAPDPCGEQGCRAHRSECEQPVGPARGRAITSHGGTRRRPCHIRNRAWRKLPGEPRGGDDAFVQIRPGSRRTRTRGCPTASRGSRRPASGGRRRTPAPRRSRGRRAPAAVGASSTPSATSRRPRSWASATVCRTIAAARRSLSHVGRQAPVELELVGRQVPQVGQRAVAGAVVVDRRPDAEAPQLPEHLPAPLRIGHEGVLDELEREGAGRQGVPDQGEGHLAGQVQVGDVGRGQVDRHRHRRARTTTGRRRRGRAPGRVSVSGRSRPGLLRRGQQVGGGEQAAGRVVPADQRLRADDPAVVQAHLRLQVHLELAVGQRGPQLLHGAQPVTGAARGVRHVDVHALAARLGRVHRDVGAAQQLLHRRARAPGRWRRRC